MFACDRFLARPADAPLRPDAPEKAAPAGLANEVTQARVTLLPCPDDDPHAYALDYVLHTREPGMPEQSGSLQSAPERSGLRSIFWDIR
jgi:hypothetical protein